MVLRQPRSVRRWSGRRGRRGPPIPWSHHEQPLRHPRGPRPLLPVAHRHAARRAGPHRAVQLGVRPAHRRHVRVPRRGHRRRPGQRGVYDPAPRGAALARAGLGRGRPRSAARTSRTGRASAANLRRRRWRGCSPPVTSTSRSPPPRRSRRATATPGRDPKLGYDNYDRDLPTSSGPALRAQGREPVLRLRMPDEDIAVDDLVRGEVTFPAGSRAGLRRRARRRPAAVHAGQPGGRRADGITHVLRGEDLLLLHAAPDRAATGRCSDRRRRAGAEVRATCRTSWARATASCPSATRESNLFAHRDARVPSGGAAELPGAARLVHRPDRDVFTVTSSSARSTSPTSRRARRGSTWRRPRRSTASISGRLAAEDFAPGWCRTCTPPASRALPSWRP